jgi:ankyrin repeat protein
MDPLRGSRKILPAPVANAVLLFKASDALPVAYYPEHFEGDYVARELHSFVFPGNLALPGSAPKTIVSQRQWEFHTFVLSGADNYRTYGHVLRFSYSVDANGQSSSRGSHLDHALVVLSSHCFFDALKAWLIPVVNDMLSSDPQRRMSVEPRISSLIHDSLAIRSNYISSTLELHSPKGVSRPKPLTCRFPLPGDTSVLPPLNFSMQSFLQSVNPNILVSIFELLLYAGHLMFISSRVSLLTTAAQACISLIWPLSWDFAIYIPVLPNQIGVEAVNFPNAAIVGMLRSHPDLPERLEDILQYNDALLIVDLDENRMIVGDNCRPSRLPPYIREKLVERLKLIFSPNLVFCDAVDPDQIYNSSAGESSEGESLTRFLTTFGSPRLKLSIDDQVRVAFLLLLRDITDSSFETKPFDEFKAAFQASPIYSLYQRNAHDNTLLKQLIRMSEDKAADYLLNLLTEPVALTTIGGGPQSSVATVLAPAFHAPQYEWKASEAALVPNEAGISTSGLSLYKSAFPAPNQRANELFQHAENAYQAALKAKAPPAALNDWILIQVTYLLKSKRHHECIRLLGKLDPEHPIFLCNDLMTLLMESLTAVELDQMSIRQSGDRLGDAARAFREAKSRQQPTSLSPESKELFHYIMTQEDTNTDTKFIELITKRNVNVNATPQGISLLSTAVSMGKLRMAAGLLRYGATPDNDAAKNTIAHSLCSTKPRDEISYLLGIRILCLALATGFNINRGDSYQATPLSLLCSRPVPFVPLLKFFLSNGADSNAVNVDEHPPSHFLVKTRMQQLVDVSPLALLLDMGANPLITEPSSEGFRALVTAASDAITNNLQPFAVYLENNKYLTAKYATLRTLKSSITTTKTAAASSSSAANPGSTRLPPLPIVPASTAPTTTAGLALASPSSSTGPEAAKTAPPSSPRSGATTSVTGATGSANVSTATSSSSSSTATKSDHLSPSASVVNLAQGAALKTRAFAMTLAPASDLGGASTSGPASVGVPGSSATTGPLDKAYMIKFNEAMEVMALSNYAIVEAQYRQLVILNALVHRYMVDVAKRKRKGTALFTKRRSTPHDCMLALTHALENLLLHHTTLSVDIRHHTTIYGSKPSVAAAFSAKMALLAEVQIEFASAFYSNDGRAHLEAMNSEDMVTILAQEREAFSSLFGSWVQSDALLGNLLTEVLDFPVKLSVLFEDLAKRAASVGAADAGKIQVLLTQLGHLRNRHDRIRHESQMVQVFEEVGHKLNGIAQFSFMMAAGTTLLRAGQVKLIRSIEAPGLSRVPPSEILPCRAYLFATSDETDNKGYLLLSTDGAVTEKKRIPLKKAIVFDIPAFSATAQQSSSGTPTPNDSSLMHPIGLVALHPSSAPHEYYLIDCPSAESKVQWLSLLWRVCFEGRNWTHKRHFYEYVERPTLSSEYEGWLDYSVDNEFSSTLSTHYFTLRGNRLVATVSPSETTPIIIIYLDEYTLHINDEPSTLHHMSLEPAKHLAPRYLLYFGAYPKVLSKYPVNSAHTDWRSLLKTLVTTTKL